MTKDRRLDRTAPKPTFAELYTPKLVTVLREGYGWPQFRPTPWPA
jgi:SulP family sulfate permease